MNHDLTTALNQLADKIHENRDKLLQATEDGTKQWIIEPFI